MEKCWPDAKSNSLPTEKSWSAEAESPPATGTASDRHPVASEDGWYRTGDVGELDAEGNLYFKGRKKEVIVTPAGMNVYPDDLEAALRRQPEVKDVVVIALPRNGNAEPCASFDPPRYQCRS